MSAPDMRSTLYSSKIANIYMLMLNVPFTDEWQWQVGRISSDAKTSGNEEGNGHVFAFTRKLGVQMELRAIVHSTYAATTAEMHFLQEIL
jgi:hypothetical protein